MHYFINAMKEENIIWTRAETNDLHSKKNMYYMFGCTNFNKEFNNI